MDVGTLIIGSFVVIWLIGVITGMAYLRGGLVSVRRVVPGLAVLIPILVVVVLVESIVTSKVGAITVGLVVLPVMVARWVFLIRRRRQARAAAPDAASAPSLFTPPIRNFAIIAFVIMFAGSILLVFVASRAGL